MSSALVASLILLATAAQGAQMEIAHYPRAVSNATTPFPAATGQASHNCSWSWSSWQDASRSQNEPFVNVTSTYIYHNITASTTVSCDNITRIVGDLTTTATGTNVTVFERYVTSVNYSEPAPTCTPPIEECISLQYYFEDIVKHCTPPATSSQEICGPCGIVGGTIDLLYFPPPMQTPGPEICATDTTKSAIMCPLGPTTATNNATNPYENMPCYYATGSTTTQNSGPYITSGDYTFYENRAYISLASVYATNRCGYVGKQHSGTIVEVASTDVYSVGGYHHFFADNGYSFDFQDLYHPPSSAYYLNCDGGGGMSCEPQQGTRFQSGLDFINGVNTVNFGRNADPVATDYWIWASAYAPIILMPTQIRSLDPAWSTCILDLAGLYDPPRALTKADAAAPTAPTPDGGYDDTTTSTTAKPGSSPGNSGPEPTSGPTTTTAVSAAPVIEASDDGPLDTPTIAESPIVQPTDSGELDAPTTSNSGSQPTGAGSAEENDEQGGNDDGDDGQGTSTSQDPGGIIVSLFDGATETPQPGSPQDSGTQDGGDQDTGSQDGGSQDGGSQQDQQPDDAQLDPSLPTGTIQNVGDVVASVLGMASSPSAESQGGSSEGESDDGDIQQSGNNVGQQSTSQDNDNDSANASSQEDSAEDNSPAPALVVFTGSSATYTASALPGSQDVYVVDGTQTVTASAAGTSGSLVEVEVDGETVVGAASPSQNDGSISPGTAAASGSETGSGDTPQQSDEGIPPSTAAVSRSGSVSSDSPQQTGNFGSRAGVDEHVFAAMAGGAALIAFGL